MDNFNNCSPFNFDLSDSFSYSLNLTEQTYQFDSEQQPMHSGMFIQAVDTLFSVYTYDNQTENQQTNADPLNSLLKYDISALTSTNPEGSFGSARPFN
ncbi:hypothetical protein J7438_21790 [Thalassotalea sp. G20_0]|uniref:hypothetical protein n=1 Tax=Thalassotalea sp. G20_0 TaxID=2821093 RepID=UPI001ADCFBC6|nr:hypothetical protein [Thalassotalea sp. G20_0]MBO9496695.1 hypothetical protein [Thalassotalea sp. G20_0]